MADYLTRVTAMAMPRQRPSQDGVMTITDRQGGGTVDESKIPAYHFPTLDKGRSQLRPTPHPARKAFCWAPTLKALLERTAVPRSREPDSPPEQIDITTAARDERAVRPGTVYLRASVLAQFHVFRTAHGFTNRDALLRAVEFSHDELGKLLAPPKGSKGLFEFDHPRLASDDPPAALSVQFRVSDYGVLDALVTEHAARNRNHLLDVCVTFFLTNVNTSETIQ